MEKDKIAGCSKRHSGTDSANCKYNSNVVIVGQVIINSTTNLLFF